MRYGDISSFQTGVAIPVFSLRSQQSCGIGEFLDLIPLAEWVLSCSMDMIQILPVNDTGEESSPYSARSAFALNPAYIRLQEVEGASAWVNTIKEARDNFAGTQRIAYRDVYLFKKSILTRIFETRKEELFKDKDLHRWIQANPWVKPYSVYCYLKEKNQENTWKNWSSHQNPTPGRIDSLWAKEWQHTLRHAWMQYEAELQFLRVGTVLEHKGVRLKGDIPILINEDSADVWAERRFFDLESRAGAPPDMFSYSGQNWGFPCYRWNILQRDDYSWWRRRLGQASKFYHAYRIDHVLGFFRIWTVPAREITGILGHFVPAIPLSPQDLEEAGFSQTTLDYLTNPNFARYWIMELFGGYGERALSTYFERLGFTGDRYRLRTKYLSEATIVSLDEPQDLKDALLKVYWNRVFLPSSSEKEYRPYWYWYQAPVFFTLPEHEQGKLRAVIQKNEQQQESLWAANGMQLLRIMVEDTDMLVCAEDLGVIPDCVPQVLQELSILSLRIERWSREWKQEGQPYISPAEYPRLSVATSSCHDSSTLAGFWEEPTFDREHYWSMLGLPGKAPVKLTAELCTNLLRRLFHSNSLLVIPPLQDLLAVHKDFLQEQPEQDRINIPGTVGSHNWSWKMPCMVEDLLNKGELQQILLNLAGERRKRPLWRV